MHRGKRAQKLQTPLSKITPEQAEKIAIECTKIYLNIAKEDKIFIKNTIKIFLKKESLPIQLSLVPLAQKSCIVWEFLCDLIHEHDILFCKGPVQIELLKFATFALKFPEKKPKHRGVDPLKNFARDHYFRSSIYLIEKLGYHPITKNGEYDVTSACEIISNTYSKLTDAKFHISHHGINKVWEKITKRDRKIFNYIIKSLKKFEKIDEKLLQTAGIASFILCNFGCQDDLFHRKRNVDFVSFYNENQTA